MTSNMITRRRLLELSGSAVATSLIAGCSGVGPGTETKLLRLGAEKSGWIGKFPDEISGRTNPTLRLHPGSTYALTWQNLDGNYHKLVITDTDGNTLHDTGSTKRKGERQTLAFQVVPEMATYHDAYYPETARGEIHVGTER